MTKTFSILHRAAALLVALCLLVGMALPVYAAEDGALFFDAGSETIPTIPAANTSSEGVEPAQEPIILGGILMDTVSKLTVYFEEPFWVGVFERMENGKLSVCKVTFGAEPKDYEVWEFVLKHYGRLVFSAAIASEMKKTADNPKRRQREVKKQMRVSGIGTKSQQALQMQREEIKMERKQISRQQREAEKQRQFDLEQQKRKEKHRGH